jgi:hypothetical protein
MVPESGMIAFSYLSDANPITKLMQAQHHPIAVNCYRYYVVLLTMLFSWGWVEIIPNLIIFL